MSTYESAARLRSFSDVARDYVSLLKLRVVALLVATALGTMLLAARGWPRPGAVLAVALGITLAAGGAHAINSWFDSRPISVSYFGATPYSSSQCVT